MAKKKNSYTDQQADEVRKMQSEVAKMNAAIERQAENYEEIVHKMQDQRRTMKSLIKLAEGLQQTEEDIEDSIEKRGKAVEKMKKAIEENNQKYQEQADSITGIQRGFGNFVKSLPGGKALAKMSGMDHLQEVTGRGVRMALAGSGNAMQKFGKAGRVAFKGLITSAKAFMATLMANPIFLIAAAVVAIGAAIGKVISGAKELDKNTSKIAKSLSISKTEAQLFRKVASELYIPFESLLHTTKAMKDDIGLLLPGMYEQAAAAKEVGFHLGLSAEESGRLATLAGKTGKTFNEFAGVVISNNAELNKTSGLFIDEADILRDITKVSADVRANFRGSAEELLKGVRQARILGIELGKMESMASGLLNIESSLQDEMTARVLTGKALNLDRARELALNNDIVGATKAAVEEVGGYSEFMDMNRIQQEALAKSIGLSKGELLRTLELEKARSVFSETNLETVKEMTDEAKKRFASEQGITEANLQTLIAAESRATAEEKFEKAKTLIQEKFTSNASALGEGIDLIARAFLKMSKGKGMLGFLFGPDPYELQNKEDLQAMEEQLATAQETKDPVKIAEAQRLLNREISQQSAQKTIIEEEGKIAGIVASATMLLDNFIEDRTRNVGNNSTATILTPPNESMSNVGITENSTGGSVALEWMIKKMDEMISALNQPAVIKMPTGAVYEAGEILTTQRELTLTS